MMNGLVLMTACGVAISTTCTLAAAGIIPPGDAGASRGRTTALVLGAGYSLLINFMGRDASKLYGTLGFFLAMFVTGAVVGLVGVAFGGPVRRMRATLTAARGAVRWLHAADIALLVLISGALGGLLLLGITFLVTLLMWGAP